MSQMKTTSELAQEFKDASQELQFSILANDEDRMRAAILAKKKAWKAYESRKKQEFKRKTYENSKNEAGG
jgi:hypothetical protein